MRVESMFILPKSGIKIFCPTTRILVPELGKETSDDVTYWTRAEMAGDVTISDFPPEVLPVEEPDE